MNSPLRDEGDENLEMRDEGYQMIEMRELGRYASVYIIKNLTYTEGFSSLK